MTRALELVVAGCLLIALVVLASGGALVSLGFRLLGPAEDRWR